MSPTISPEHKKLKKGGILRGFFQSPKSLSFYCPRRNLDIGFLSDEFKLTVTLDAGCVVLKDTNTVYDEKRTEIHTVKEGQPITAKVAIHSQVTMKREDETADQSNSGRNPWNTKVEASSEMWADERFFYFENHLTAWHCSEECFDRKWTKKIERFHV